MKFQENTEVVDNEYFNNIPNEDKQEGSTSEEEEKKQRKLKHNAKNFIRVGDNYYKIVYRPNKDKSLYKDYLKLNKGTIIDDHTHGIIKYIPKYDDFCMVASHVNYQQVINGFYNEYSELKHKPKNGNCDTILAVINHVFGEHYFDFALDYLQLLYLNPYQRLPILLLESQEKNTGKSTFANVVYKIFQDNAIKIGNNDLQSDFNSVWVKRLAIIVDETSLEKKGITQMLKRFSTETGKVTVNEKNKAQTEVDFFGKFIFISNEEGKALFIERGDPRWAVFKVPTFAERGTKDDPLIDEKIDAEIPAFLHFLNQRRYKYSHQSRMYFDPSVYQTAQLQLYYNNSISKVAQYIKKLIIDTFDLYPKEDIIKLGIADIMEELKPELRTIEREGVRSALEKELNKAPQPRTHYTLFSRKNIESNHLHYPTTNGQNKVHYTFSRFEAETWKSTNGDF
ncbi:primase-helicase family protein [Runella sp. SP2]|uniref:primase-helicase family protein n=1 Tax=Runella sp. SP2 TaxID=2268026 RepID=UPI000F087D8A|nr:DUF5906 domain-containing protein [Runella sp. SP2]AYQ32517.1 hypothetical protein DTQ70_10220 [Runella sp. SP2]